jgi:hypothetical protein
MMLVRTSGTRFQTRLEDSSARSFSIMKLYSSPKLPFIQPVNATTLTVHLPFDDCFEIEDDGWT